LNEAVNKYRILRLFAFCGILTRVVPAAK